MAEEINFEDMTDKETELGIDDFEQGKWVNNPEVGSTVEFVVEKVVQNKMIEGKNKTSGAKFHIGLKQKDGTVKRYDIYSDLGVYTIKSWEIFFKLLGPDGLLIKYAKDHNKSFKGAKICIKKNLNGGHMSTKIDDLMAILKVEKDEAIAYQNKIKEAIKEKRLFTVTLLD